MSETMAANRSDRVAARLAEDPKNSYDLYGLLE